MTETVLSQQAFDRLRDELDQLRNEERPRISQVIEEARSHGDIRENAEYHSAKEEQGKLEFRIRQIEALLADARIGGPVSADRAQPGTVVTLDVDGDEETYLLVASREDRSDTYDVLSTASPLGRAVLGAREGDTISADAPSGAYKATVKRIQLP